MGSLTWWGSTESLPRWLWGFLLHFTRERGQNVILGIKLPQQCFWMKASKKFRCQKLPGGRLWKAQEFLLSIVLDMRGPRSPRSEQSVGEQWGHQADVPSWSTRPLWCHWWSPPSPKTCTCTTSITDRWQICMAILSGCYGITKTTWGISCLKAGSCTQPASYHKRPLQLFWVTGITWHYSWPPSISLCSPHRPDTSWLHTAVKYCFFPLHLWKGH